MATSPPPPPPPGSPAKRSQTSSHRISRGQVAAIAAAVTALLIIIFAAQNSGPLDVNLLFWTLRGAPVFVVIVVAVILGFALGLSFPFLRRRRQAR